MAGTLGVKFGSFQNALCGTVTTLVLAVISAHVAAEIEQTRGHLETVEVTAQATNASNDIDHQRNADKIVAVQTSEAIGELPDANVSEALQRIPGQGFFMNVFCTAFKLHNSLLEPKNLTFLL